MKRRRKPLEVSTFPFLAVLLCTMGALILVLLAIDRRARAVTLAREVQRLGQLEAEDEAVVRAREAEWERRRQALHDALAEQLADTTGKAKELKKKKADAEATLAAIEARFRELHKRTADSKTDADQARKALASKKEESAAAEKQSAELRARLALMAADLDHLEQALADLKKARERQNQTYSLVPYRGKHGDSRRPLYVECTETGIIMHPDHKALEGPLVSRSDIRAEVARRIEAQRAALREAGETVPAKPYLLMLIRPSGIDHYYRTMSSLSGLEIEYGYEMIEEDWALDFPTEDDRPATKAWASGNIPATTAPVPHADQGPLPSASSSNWVGIHGPGGGGGGDAILGQRPGGGAARGARQDTVAMVGGSGGPLGTGMGPGGTAAFSGPGTDTSGGAGAGGPRGPPGFPGTGPIRGYSIGKGPRGQGGIYGMGDPSGTGNGNGGPNAIGSPSPLAGGADWLGNGTGGTGSGNGRGTGSGGNGPGGTGTGNGMGNGPGGNGPPGGTGNGTGIGTGTGVNGTGTGGSGTGNGTGTGTAGNGTGNGPGGPGTGNGTGGNGTGGAGTGTGTGAATGDGAAGGVGNGPKPGKGSGNGNGTGDGTGNGTGGGAGNGGKPGNGSGNGNGTGNGNGSGTGPAGNGAGKGNGNDGPVINPFAGMGMSTGTGTGTGNSTGNGNGSGPPGSSTTGNGTPGGNGASGGNGQGSANGAGGTTPGGNGTANGTGTGNVGPGGSGSGSGAAPGTNFAITRYTPPNNGGGTGGQSATGGQPGSGNPNRPGKANGPPGQPGDPNDPNEPSFTAGDLPTPETKNDGQSGGGNGPTSKVLAKLSHGGSGFPERPSRPPIRLGPNRDWVINVECTADSVMVPAAGTSLKLSAIEAAGPGVNNPLFQTVRGMIDQRQATVRAGDEPYQPQIRFRVKPDGLRAYYAAYPALMSLQLPMSKETVEPPVHLRTEEIRP
jgi:hypothetical protein